MNSNPENPPTFDFCWLTPERWPDLEALFGPRGACNGCWCMFWRLRGKSFGEGCGAPNRAAFQAIVEAGEAPGILAYHQGRAVGWVALAPREVYPRLQHSRVLYPVDDTSVWAITCFYVEKHYRRQGLMRALLEAIKPMARARGAQALEGYPVAARHSRMAATEAYTGVASTYRDAGFVEVARRGPAARPVMRFDLTGIHPAAD